MRAGDKKAQGGWPTRSIPQNKQREMWRISGGLSELSWRLSVGIFLGIFGAFGGTFGGTLRGN